MFVCFHARNNEEEFVPIARCATHSLDLYRYYDCSHTSAFVEPRARETLMARDRKTFAVRVRGENSSDGLSNNFLTTYKMYPL